MSPRKIARGFGIVLGLCLAALVNGCGTRVGTGLTGSVTLKSEAFSTTGLMALSPVGMLAAYTHDLVWGAPTRFAGPTVTDFKICIRELKLEKADGNYADKDGSGSLEYKIGLIDVSNGAEKTWMTSDFPVGFTLQRVKVVVHKDESLCGVNYSIKFNGFESNSDVEFKFKFEPAAEVVAGSTIKVALATVVSTLRAAADATALNDNNLKDYIEGVEGSGKKE